MPADALAAAATLVSLAFACSTLERWTARRRRHELAWSVSLFMFAAGSLALWAGASLGWGEWSFRAFYLFGGVLNVPFLALGTVYLLGGTRVGDRVGMVVALVAAFAAGVVTVAPLRALVDPDVFPEGKELFGPLPRIFAGVGSGLAALVIIGGALWSAGSLVRSRRRPGTGGVPGISPGRLAAANVLIAIGTMVISGKALFESLGDAETAFAAALATGITIIFAGFLLTLRSPTQATDPIRRPALPAGGGARATEPSGAPTGHTLDVSRTSSP